MLLLVLLLLLLLSALPGCPAAAPSVRHTRHAIDTTDPSTYLANPASRSDALTRATWRRLRDPPVVAYHALADSHAADDDDAAAELAMAAAALTPNSTEAAALVAFFTSMNGANWTYNKNWASDTWCCYWYGITCALINGSYHVTEVSLRFNNLQGELDDSLSSLTSLVILDLSINSAIAGAIPDSFAQLQNLTQLYFSLAALTGPFPTSLCAMQSLFWLDLRSNQLSGSLPDCIAGMTALSNLYLSHNSFSGQLPDVFRGLSSLEVIDVGNNALTGDLSALSLAALLSVTAIFANSNQLSGPLDLELLTLSSPPYLLDLSDNQYTWPAGYNYTANDNSFYVEVLLLSGNNLSVELTEAVQCLSYLAPSVVWAELSNTGMWWDGDRFYFVEFYDWELLLRIDLSDNFIQGPVDGFLNQMYNVGQVEYLNFSNNLLYGTATSVAGTFWQLVATGNPGLAADFDYTANPPKVILPSWLALDYNSLQQLPGNLVCPQIGPGDSDLQLLSMDASYLAYQQCNCSSGYAVDPSANFSVPTSVSCVPCPQYVDCSPLVYAPHHSVQPGYFPWPIDPAGYTANSQLLISATMIACTPASVCVSANASVVGCRAGHDPSSFLCSACLPNYFTFSGYCQSCGANDDALWLPPVVIILVGTLALAFAVHYFQHEEELLYLQAAPPSTDDPKTGTMGRLTRCALGFLRGLTCCLQSCVSCCVRCQREPRQPLPSALPLIAAQHWAVFDIALFWYQLSSVLQGINYGDTTASSSSGSSMANLSAVGNVLRFSPFSFECIFPGVNFNSYFWVIVLSPLWIAAILYFLSFLRSRWHAYRVSKNRADSYYPTHVYARASFRLMFLLWNVVYMQVAIFFFEVLRCESVAGHEYLLAAPYVTCYTPQHVAEIIVGLLVFVFFNFGLLVATWRLRGEPTNKQQREPDLEEPSSGCDPWRSLIRAKDLLRYQVRRSVSSESLKLRATGWQLMVLGRKLVLTAIVYLVASTSLALPVLVLLILLLIISMAAWYKPYYRFVDNVFECFVLLEIAFEFLVAILQGQSALMQQPATYDSMTRFLQSLSDITFALVVLVALAHMVLYVKSAREPAAELMRLLPPERRRYLWNWLNSVQDAAVKRDPLLDPSATAHQMKVSSAGADPDCPDDSQPPPSPISPMGLTPQPGAALQPLNVVRTSTASSTLSVYLASRMPDDDPYADSPQPAISPIASAPYQALVSPVASALPLPRFWQPAMQATRAAQPAPPPRLSLSVAAADPYATAAVAAAAADPYAEDAVADGIPEQQQLHR